MESETITLSTSFWCLYCQFWPYFTPFSSVSIADFKHVDVCWEKWWWLLLHYLSIKKRFSEYFWDIAKVLITFLMLLFKFFLLHYISKLQARSFTMHVQPSKFALALGNYRCFCRGKSIFSLMCVSKLLPRWNFQHSC